MTTSYPWSAAWWRFQLCMSAFLYASFSCTFWKPLPRNFIFTVQHVMQRTVLLSQFCLCLSVRSLVKYVYYHKTTWCTADILIPHERAITLLLWDQEWLVGDAPFPLKFALSLCQFRLWLLKNSPRNVNLVCTYIFSMSRSRSSIMVVGQGECHTNVYKYACRWSAFD